MVFNEDDILENRQKIFSDARKVLVTSLCNFMFTLKPKVQDALVAALCYSSKGKLKSKLQRLRHGSDIETRFVLLETLSLSEVEFELLFSTLADD